MMQVFRRPMQMLSDTPLSVFTEAVICTGACGRFGTGLHFSANANVSSNSSIVRSGGTHTILFETSGAGAETAIFAPFAPANVWNGVSERCYIYFETLPSANTRILTHTTSAGGISTSICGLAYHQSSGQLRFVDWGSFFNSYSFESTGIGVTTGQWYRIDMKVENIAGTITFDAQINGTALTQKGYAPFNSFIGSPIFGDFNNRTQKWRIADYYGINSVNAYPIGAGYVRRFSPMADGSHNITSAGDFIVGAAGANITNASTTSYQLIDEIPLDTTTPDTDDYITQTNDAGGGAEYAEHIFDSPDSFTPTQPPRGIDVIVAYHQATTSSGNSSFRLTDNGTESAIVTLNGAGVTDIRYTTKHFANPPTNLTGWKIVGTDGNFNNLRHRFGYSSDGNPNQSFDGVIIEAEFPE